MLLPKGSIMIWRTGVLRSVNSVTGAVSLGDGRVLDTWADISTSNEGTSRFVVPSEHSRASLDVSIERLGNSSRMWNGRMRKFIVGDKRTFSTSWTLLPYDSDATVDKKAGINDMEEFYDNNQGYFILTIVPGDAFKDSAGVTQAQPDVKKIKHYQVMFSEFAPNISKRVANDKGDLSVSIEEV